MTTIISNLRSGSEFWKSENRSSNIDQYKSLNYSVNVILKFIFPCSAFQDFISIILFFPISLFLKLRLLLKLLIFNIPLHSYKYLLWSYVDVFFVNGIPARTRNEIDHEKCQFDKNCVLSKFSNPFFILFSERQQVKLILSLNFIPYLLIFWIAQNYN